MYISAFLDLFCLLSIALDKLIWLFDTYLSGFFHWDHAMVESNPECIMDAITNP